MSNFLLCLSYLLQVALVTPLISDDKWTGCICTNWRTGIRSCVTEMIKYLWSLVVTAIYSGKWFYQVGTATFTLVLCFFPANLTIPLLCILDRRFPQSVDVCDLFRWQIVNPRKSCARWRFNHPRKVDVYDLIEKKLEQTYLIHTIHGIAT